MKLGCVTEIAPLKLHHFCMIFFCYAPLQMHECYPWCSCVSRQYCSHVTAHLLCSSVQCLLELRRTLAVLA